MTKPQHYQKAVWAAMAWARLTDRTTPQAELLVQRYRRHAEAAGVAYWQQTAVHSTK